MDQHESSDFYHEQRSKHVRNLPIKHPIQMELKVLWMFRSCSQADSIHMSVQGPRLW